MPRKKQISIEGCLGDAIRAVGTDRFSKRLALALDACCDFDNLIILAFRDEDRPIELYREFKDPRVFQWMEEEYLPAGYLLDPFYQAHINRFPSGFWRLTDIAPDQFKRTSYFRRYYEKTTMIDEIAAIAYTRTGNTIQVSLGRDLSSAKRFQKSAIATLKKFEAPLIALIESHWQKVAFDEPIGRLEEASAVERLASALEQQYGIKITKRQSQVAIMILRGHSSESIGSHLKISPQTVKVFRKQLYARCNICSQAELFALMMPLIGGVSV